MLIESALKSELDDHLNYVKHDPTNRDSDNSRKNHQVKTVITDTKPMQITLPRDRDSSFKPKILTKTQPPLTPLHHIMISLSTKTLTHPEIHTPLTEIHLAQISNNNHYNHPPCDTKHHLIT